MIHTYIASLVQYGLNTGLIEECDKVYITNTILETLGLYEYAETVPAELPLRRFDSKQRELKRKSEVTKSTRFCDGKEGSWKSIRKTDRKATMKQAYQPPVKSKIAEDRTMVEHIAKEVIIAKVSFISA